MKQNPLKKISIDLVLRKEYLRGLSSRAGNEDWQTIKDLLEQLGFEIKYVHVTINGMPESCKPLSFALERRLRNSRRLNAANSPSGGNVIQSA